MLDKLLEDLKKKLPGAKKADDSEDQEEVTEESEEESNEESDEESPKGKEESKKKSSPLIKIVIILAVGYLAFDFLMPKDDTTDIDQMVQTPVPRKKKPKKDREQEASQAEAPAVTENQAVGTKPEATQVTEEKTDDELSKAISDIPTETKPAEPSADLSSAPVEEINVFKNAETPETSPETSSPTPTSTSSFDGLGEGNESKAPTTSSSMESKIAEQAVYVDPPKYEILGRGLVYNCKGKHWACVDKANYQVCHKNMKYNSENGKASECVTQNVYANEEDCNTVQRYNVSTSVSTSFCK